MSEHGTCCETKSSSKCCWIWPVIISLLLTCIATSLWQIEGHLATMAKAGGH